MLSLFLPHSPSTTLHRHLRLQLPQFLLLIILLDPRRSALPLCNLRLRRLWQAAHFVAYGHGTRVEHLLVELFLLELCEFLVEIVFVDGGGADA